MQSTVSQDSGKPFSTELVVTVSFVTQRKYIWGPWTALFLVPASTRHVYTGSHFSAISRGNLQGKHIHTYCASWLVSLRGTTCLVPRITDNLVIKWMHPGHVPPPPTHTHTQVMQFTCQAYRRAENILYDRGSNPQTSDGCWKAGLLSFHNMPSVSLCMLKNISLVSENTFC